MGVLDLENQADGRSLRRDRGWWTEARVAELEVRWNSGESAGEIYRAMQAPSRSAVIGKLHRLGRSREAGQRTKQINRIPMPKAKPVIYINGHYSGGPATMLIETPQTPFKSPKRFVELTVDECHWPGDGLPGPDILCCAEPVRKDRPYCAAHCRQAYVKAPPPKPR